MANLLPANARLCGALMHSQCAGKILQQAAFGFHEHGFEVNAKVWLIT
jgi:hypothetical protein